MKENNKRALKHASIYTLLISLGFIVFDKFNSPEKLELQGYWVDRLIKAVIFFVILFWFNRRKKA